MDSHPFLITSREFYRVVEQDFSEILEVKEFDGRGIAFTWYVHIYRYQYRVSGNSPGRGLHIALGRYTISTMVYSRTNGICSIDIFYQHTILLPINVCVYLRYRLYTYNIYGAFHAQSIRLKPSLFFVSFKYIIDGRKTMAYRNCQIFLKISLLIMVEIVDLAPRAFTDFFENTINSLIKKNFETNFIMSEALFRVGQPKQNKECYYYYSWKYWVFWIIFFFNKIASFEHKP